MDNLIADLDPSDSLVTYRSWRERETIRQTTRLMPVWCKEPFWTENASRNADHFVHVSTKDPQLLAYTATEEKGERDIQTPVKPGKYLMTYFKEILTERHIKFLAEWQIAGGARPNEETVKPKYELLFAWTPQEIFDVYLKGPSSCMVFDTFARSPVRIYGAGDLAVAYIRNTRKAIIARAVVYPEKKAASKIYTNDRYDTQKIWGEFQTVLKEHGYKFAPEGATFEGARLLKERHGDFDRYHDEYLIPSIEIGPEMMDAEGDFFVLRCRGKYRKGRGPKA